GDLSRGSVLPHRGRAHRDTGAPRASQGHSAARLALPPRVHGVGPSPGHPGPHVACDERADELRVAGERASAQELDRGGPRRAAGRSPCSPLGLRLEDLERWYVLETLRRADGNRTKAARQLGISLRGLQYKLRRYGTTLGTTEPDVTGGAPGVPGNGLGAMRQWQGPSQAPTNG